MSPLELRKLAQLARARGDYSEAAELIAEAMRLEREEEREERHALEPA